MRACKTAEKIKNCRMAKRFIWIGVWLSSTFAAGFGFRAWQRPSAKDLVFQAQAALDWRRYEEAGELLKQLVFTRPDKATSQHRLILAKLSAQQSDWSTVVAALAGVDDSDPNAVVARIAEGDAWRNLQRAQRAEDCWRRALALDPEARSARTGLLYLYSIQLRRDLWIEKLWELYDRGQAGQKELIQLLIAGEVVWETKTLIDEVAGFAAADPADVHDRRALAVYLLRSGRATEAVTRLRQLHERHPEDEEVWFALVEALLALGDAEAAGSLLDAPPDAAARDFRYWKFLGSRHLLQEQYEKASDAFETSVAMFPFDLIVRNRYAQALRFANRAHEARRQAEAAQQLSTIQRLCHTIDTYGWNSEKVLPLIEACEKVGLIEEALGWTRLALLRYPDDENFQRLDQRLRTLPLTSIRRIPKGEDQP